MAKDRLKNYCVEDTEMVTEWLHQDKEIKVTAFESLVYLIGVFVIFRAIYMY